MLRKERVANSSILSDDELLALMKGGDIAAFTMIHDRYYGLLYSHAYKRLPEREEVKDMLQELFAYLWKHRETISFTTSLPAYLYTATRNRILNVYKHQKIKSDYIASFQAYLGHPDPIPDEILREKELVALVEQEVAALPAQMRLVFEMSRNQHLSHQEIADQLNISPLATFIL